MASRAESLCFASRLALEPMRGKFHGDTRTKSLKKIHLRTYSALRGTSAALI